MEKFLLAFMLPLFVLQSRAQDSILHRVILIGDAGQINVDQNAVIANAEKLIITNKTTALYLGDNVYPSGVGSPGSDEEAETKKILQSQFTPMRKGGAAVYFIPGNHDWDKSGPKGLQKIKLQGKYLNEQDDALIRMVPPNGCPDPVDISLTDSLSIIAFDSEWWVHKYDKTDSDGTCNCQTEEDVLNKLAGLLEKNKHKVILLASHHPFQTYGAHGGYFTLKDHLFPLTAASKHLYLPLPIVGSLYPLLRTVFPNRQDMMHPSYKHMIRRIDSVVNNFPNLIHVSGHEHGLQLIKDGDDLQVVSGSGAKLNTTRKGKHALFSKSSPGFVIADFLRGNKVRLVYYESSSSGQARSVFTYIEPYSFRY